MRCKSFGPVLLTACCITSIALGADYPTRPVRLVVPFPAGGTNDIVGRVIGARMADILNQSVVVENRPGAAGAVGTAELARAAPDGYTIGVASQSTMATGPACNPKAGYDPISGFQPIAQIATVANMVVTAGSSPVQSFEEMVENARRRPDQITFATAGLCSMQHLIGEQLQASSGTRLTHIPYRGSASAITDVITGRVTMMIDNWPALASYIESGQVRLLAVGWPQRLASLKDAPTFEELGMPEINAPSWYGLIAPANTPGDVVAKLAEAATSALRDPKVTERLRTAGAEPNAGTPDQFGRTIATELAIARDRVARFGIQPQ